jgi:hypothetical protein
MSGQVRKTYRDTNMWIAGQLPCPNTFLITGIRCIFLDALGELLPINHQIYWTSVLSLQVNCKEYWRSPVADVVDPMILTTPQQWEGLDDNQKVNLMQRFGQQNYQKPIQPDKIRPLTMDQKVRFGVPEIKGIYLDIQQVFQIQIDHSSQHHGLRALCVLQGASYRPVL